MDTAEKKYVRLNKFNELIFAPEVINDGVNLIINPTPEQLRQYGYNELIYSDKPEYDEETEYIEEKYQDLSEDGYILAYYEVHKNNMLDEPQP